MAGRGLLIPDLDGSTTVFLARIEIIESAFTLVREQRVHLAHYGADFLELLGGMGNPTPVLVVNSANAVNHMAQ